MESETQENPSQTDPVANKTLHWTRLSAIWAKYNAIITTIGVAIAAISFIVTMNKAAITTPGHPVTHNDGTAATTAISTGAPPADPSDLSSTPPTGCFKDDSPVPCSSPHDKEVFQPGEGLSCDTSGLITYLGGQPGVDLLNADLEVAAANSDGTLCAITSKNDLPHTSIEGIWAPGRGSEYPAGGQFRRCLDSRGNPTPCNDEHFSEIIYEGPDDVDCEAKYSEFTGRSLKEDYSTIKVLSSSSGEQKICTAALRSNSDALTASLRWLHSKALPVRR